MRSSRLGGPRAVTRPAASPWAESRPSGHLVVMNALDSYLASRLIIYQYVSDLMHEHQLYISPTHKQWDYLSTLKVLLYIFHKRGSGLRQRRSNIHNYIWNNYLLGYFHICSNGSPLPLPHAAAASMEKHLQTITFPVTCVCKA